MFTPPHSSQSLSRPQLPRLMREEPILISDIICDLASNWNAASNGDEAFPNRPECLYRELQRRLSSNGAFVLNVKFSTTSRSLAGPGPSASPVSQATTGKKSRRQALSFALLVDGDETEDETDSDCDGLSDPSLDASSSSDESAKSASGKNKRASARNRRKPIHAAPQSSPFSTVCLWESPDHWLFRLQGQLVALIKTCIDLGILTLAWVHNNVSLPPHPSALFSHPHPALTASFPSPPLPSCSPASSSPWPTLSCPWRYPPASSGTG
jgi:hypothetical protein